MTNYERIMQMSIEEMKKNCDNALELAGKGSCEYCVHFKQIVIGWYICEKYLKQWLESEVTENENR